jgi:hypothetical protein
MAPCHPEPGAREAGDEGSAFSPAQIRAIVRVSPSPSIRAAILAGALLSANVRLAQTQIRRPSTTPLPPPSLVHGRLVTVDDGPVAGMRALIDWGSVVDTVLFDAIGRFAMLPGSSRGDSLTLIVEAADSGRYHRVRARISAQRISGALDVLLIPRLWRVDGGRFAGAEVPIDVDAVLRRGDDRGSFGRLRGKQLIGWTVGSFPVPVVLRRDSGSRLSEDDSIAFWSTVRTVEQSLGGRYFLPAGDTLLRGTIYPVDIRIDPRLNADAKTWVSWNRDGQIFEGLISFRSSAELRSESVVGHELLHLLGFGHTAAWPSTLSPRITNGTGVTAADVAYAQLLLRAHELERSLEIVGGFTASMLSRP